MRTILLNICLTAIALCLFKMLIPENAMKKQTNFLIACFFLASLMFFFTSGKVDFANKMEEFNFGQIESSGSGSDSGSGSGKSRSYIDFDAEYSKAQRMAISREIRARLNEILAAENIFPEEIYTIVSISDNISDKYSISINEIRLVFAKKSSGREVESENEENAENAEEFEILKKAIHIVQKEVGDGILVTGEFKRG